MIARWVAVPVALSLLLAFFSACSPGPDLPAFLPDKSAAPLSWPALPAVPERRLLLLDFPAVVRVGDVERVYLTLEVLPDPQGQANAIASVYETHYVWAEARLDIPGLRVMPEQTVSETMFPGQKIAFFWSVRALAAGNYEGMLWLYLRFIPKQGGNESRRALSAHVVQIEAVTFGGLTADAARWLGLAGLAFAVAAGFPFIQRIKKDTSI